MIIAVVGAGGKTTLIKKLAKQYREQGKKVFVTTSTHMFRETDPLLSDEPENPPEAGRNGICHGGSAGARKDPGTVCENL